MDKNRHRQCWAGEKIDRLLVSLTNRQIDKKTVRGAATGVFILMRKKKVAKGDWR